VDGYEVDERDRELLQLLLDNARLPVELLAEELNVDPVEIEQRIARMEDIGIIKAYRAVVDPYLYSLYFHENGPFGLRAQAARRARR
jgi:Lrp/AsnC family leucine-responsive transcriptional regulator